MIIVTGSKGMIGGCLSKRLMNEGYVVVGIDEDNRIDLLKILEDGNKDVEMVFHLGANTNTLEIDKDVFIEYNSGYSKSLWYKCCRNKIPIIYASSAATYGDGNLGYSDSIHPNDLRPLNAYGESKNEFDRFVLSHNHLNDPPFWVGLKFFNVYGYDESHKGKMASMVYHIFNQIKRDGIARLFNYGEQLRDFIYVEDVVDVMVWMMKNKHLCNRGIYNIGTGRARSFNDLASAVFNSMGLPVKTKYFEMPKEMIGKYQGFTQADVSKLRNCGYDKKFTKLEDGVFDYINKLSVGV